MNVTKEGKIIIYAATQLIGKRAIFVCPASRAKDHRETAGDCRGQPQGESAGRAPLVQRRSRDRCTGRRLNCGTGTGRGSRVGIHLAGEFERADRVRFQARNRNLQCRYHLRRVVPTHARRRGGATQYGLPTAHNCGRRVRDRYARFGRRQWQSFDSSGRLRAGCGRRGVAHTFS